MKEKNLSSLRRILPLLAAATLLCSLVYVAGQLLIPILSGQAIDHMLGRGRVELAPVLRAGALIACTAALSALCQHLLALCNNKITSYVCRDLRNRLNDKFHRLPLSYLDAHPIGDLVSRMVADVDTFADGLLMYGVVSKRYGAVCIQIVGMRYPFFIDNSLETCLFYAGAVIAKQICFISYLLGLAPDGIAVFIRIVIVYASIIKFECNKFISFQFRCKYFSFTDTLLHRTKSVFCRIFPFCIQVVGSGFSIFIRKFYFTGQHVAVFIKHITDTVDFYWSGSSYHLIILIQNSVLKLFLSISFNAVPAFLQITYFRSRSK